jgi:hypothetical protein
MNKDQRAHHQGAEFNDTSVLRYSLRSVVMRPQILFQKQISTRSCAEQSAVFFTSDDKVKLATELIKYIFIHDVTCIKLSCN